MMNFMPSNNHSSSYGAFRPSSSLAPQQAEPDVHEAPTLHDVPIPIDFLDVEGFAVNLFLFHSPQVPPPADP